MGKSQKIKIGTTGTSKRQPLERQVMDDDQVRSTTRQKVRKRMDADDEFVDERLSRKIIEQAKQQQADLEEEHGIGEKKMQKQKITSLGSGQNASDSEDSDSDVGEASYYENIEMNDEDEKALEMFMNKSAPVRRTLYDIIQEKLTEIETHISDTGSVNVTELDDKVVEMYKGVKQVLSRYRSGKLPKAFKVIPALANWEQILYLTEPENWTAAAMYQATRIFASNLREKMAQRFFNLVLLPRIQDDIAEYKKLNFHLYEALRKALFKPGAFFKGIILPLCESGTCTLREAIIISSVIAKNSIPVLHSSAAILKIAEMEYTGANSIFLRILLDKKYALPFRVIDAMVYHFLKFSTDKRELPVLWHQCFLTFAQRYKEDVSSEQKEALLDLLRIHGHHSITQEIRRELQHSKCRDVEMDEPTQEPATSVVSD